MSIGSRLRFMRKKRGMTQREFGLLIGMPEKYADARVTQYEIGARTPKQDLINSIAARLDISPAALNVPDIDTELGLIHTLFALEDMYGVKAKTIDGEIHICFNGTGTSPQFYNYLVDWADARERMVSEKVTKENYDRWRYNYPDYSIDTFDSSAGIKTPEQQIAEFEAIQYRFYSEHPEAASREYLEAHPELLEKLKNNNA